MSVVSKSIPNVEFMFAYGSFIVLWNHAEIAVRNVLLDMVGGKIAGTLLAHQAGNVAVTETIKIASDWHPIMKTHLLHLSELMDRIRAYRNYYVHSFIGLGNDTETGEAVGFIISVEAKGRYRVVQNSLKIADIAFISEKTNELRLYGREIEKISKVDDLVERRKLSASLQKPPLPDRLSKTVSGQR